MNTPIAIEAYDEAILALGRGLRQLEPDGLPCAVCSDSGHQAFECHHNPIVIMRRWSDFLAQAELLHQALHQAIIQNGPDVEAASSLHEILHNIIR